MKQHETAKIVCWGGPYHGKWYSVLTARYINFPKGDYNHRYQVAGNVAYYRGKYPMKAMP